ncbi:MAG: ABC transporter permease [Ruminococcus sp.]|nr:ABC transporter permease [Ruminococcus sp.]
MSIWENIKIAVFSIRTNMMRSILTMLGIIIGVASVIAIITVGNGGKDFVVDLMSDMSSGAVSIQVSTGASESERITKEDIEDIKKIETIKYASPLDYKIGSAFTDNESAMCLALSGNEDLSKVMNISMRRGRFFTEEENKNGSKVCVITELGALAMFNKIDCTGEYINFKLSGQTVKLQIIGVTSADLSASTSSANSSVSMFSQASFSSASDNPMMAIGSQMIAIVTPITVTDNISGNSGNYDMLYVMAADEENADTVGNAAKNILYAKHGNFGSDVYTVMNMEAYTEMVDKIINVFTTFVAGISAIALLVGGIGVMNIMLVSVTERTREIGIRKALGAKTSTIMFQFLTESIILCVIGGLVGFIIGVLMAAGVAEFAGITIKIEATTILIAVGFSSAVGIFFGLYPARKAAKMLPIEALRRD